MNTLTISEVSNDRNGKVEPKSDDENAYEDDAHLERKLLDNAWSI